MADAKILATIERSETEQLQISISEYKGRSYLNMRIHYTTDDGNTWLPTKKGVTFTPEQLDILTEAIEEAKKKGVTKEEELLFLISHGVMHLLGFDHQTEDDFSFVVTNQKNALKSIGIIYDKI